MKKNKQFKSLLIDLDHQSQCTASCSALALRVMETLPLNKLTGRQRADVAHIKGRCYYNAYLETMEGSEDNLINATMHFEEAIDVCDYFDIKVKAHYYTELIHAQLALAELTNDEDYRMAAKRFANTAMNKAKAPDEELIKIWRTLNE